MRTQTTLVYLLRHGQICLGQKKRGFGEGYFNGFGGKIEDGETIPEAALRELKEESGVDARMADLENRGAIEFFFEDGCCIETNVFFLRRWKGEPYETDEMVPQWFLWTDIPYHAMWQDDQYWMPRALAGKKVNGKVWFDESGVNIKHMEWAPF